MTRPPMADASNSEGSEAAAARALCQRFANEHKLVFEDQGECGFGRPCVGFLADGNWLAHNPDRLTPSRYGHDYTPIADLACEACYAPEGVDAYHKHDCFAVLGRGAEAIMQLAVWVRHLEAAGKVEVVQYATGATGIQALLSGVVSKALVVRPVSQ